MHDSILITGIGGPAGRGSAVYFQGKGLRVVGTDIKETGTSVNAFYKIPAAGDPSFLHALLNIIRQENISLLVPTVTEELPFISRVKDIIAGYGCSVFISPFQAIDITNNKLTTAHYMSAHNIPVPLTFERSSPISDILEKLGLPLISKPLVSRGGRGVKLYWSQEELYKETREDIVYQEFIPGDEFDLNLFIDNESCVTANVVLKKTLLKQGLVGNALAVERIDREDIACIGASAANVLNMKGPLNMDIRLRKDGAPALLEINARIGGNILFAPETLDSLIKAWRFERCA